MWSTKIILTIGRKKEIKRTRIKTGEIEAIKAKTVKIKSLKSLKSLKIENKE